MQTDDSAAAEARAARLAAARERIAARTGRGVGSTGALSGAPGAAAKLGVTWNDEAKGEAKGAAGEEGSTLRSLAPRTPLGTTRWSSINVDAAGTGAGAPSLPGARSPDSPSTAAVPATLAAGVGRGLTTRRRSLDDGRAGRSEDAPGTTTGGDAEDDVVYDDKEGAGDALPLGEAEPGAAGHAAGDDPLVHTPGALAQAPCARGTLFPSPVAAPAAAFPGGVPPVIEPLGGLALPPQGDAALSDDAAAPLLDAAAALMAFRHLDDSDLPSEVARLRSEAGGAGSHPSAARLRPRQASAVGSLVVREWLAAATRAAKAKRAAQAATAAPAASAEAAGVAAEGPAGEAGSGAAAAAAPAAAPAPAPAPAQPLDPLAGVDAAALLRSLLPEPVLLPLRPPPVDGTRPLRLGLAPEDSPRAGGLPVSGGVTHAAAASTAALRQAARALGVGGASRAGAPAASGLDEERLLPWDPLLLQDPAGEEADAAAAGTTAPPPLLRVVRPLAGGAADLALATREPSCLSLRVGEVAFSDHRLFSQEDRLAADLTSLYKVYAKTMAGDPIAHYDSQLNSLLAFTVMAPGGAASPDEAALRFDLERDSLPDLLARTSAVLHLMSLRHDAVTSVAEMMDQLYAKWSALKKWRAAVGFTSTTPRLEVRDPGTGGAAAGGGDAPVPAAYPFIYGLTRLLSHLHAAGTELAAGSPDGTPLPGSAAALVTRIGDLTSAAEGLLTRINEAEERRGAGYGLGGLGSGCSAAIEAADLAPSSTDVASAAASAAFVSTFPGAKELVFVLHSDADQLTPDAAVPEWERLRRVAVRSTYITVEVYLNGNYVDRTKPARLQWPAFTAATPAAVSLRLYRRPTSLQLRICDASSWTWRLLGPSTLSAVYIPVPGPTGDVAGGSSGGDIPTVAVAPLAGTYSFSAPTPMKVPPTLLMANAAPGCPVDPVTGGPPPALLPGAPATSAPGSRPGASTSGIVVQRLVHGSVSAVTEWTSVEAATRGAALLDKLTAEASSLLGGPATSVSVEDAGVPAAPGVVPLGGTLAPPLYAPGEGLGSAVASTLAVKARHLVDRIGALQVHHVTGAAAALGARSRSLLGSTNSGGGMPAAAASTSSDAAPAAPAPNAGEPTPTPTPAPDAAPAAAAQPLATGASARNNALFSPEAPCLPLPSGALQPTAGGALRIDFAEAARGGRSGGAGMGGPEMARTSIGSPFAARTARRTGLASSALGASGVFSFPLDATAASGRELVFGATRASVDASSTPRDSAALAATVAAARTGVLGGTTRVGAPGAAADPNDPRSAPAAGGGNAAEAGSGAPGMSRAKLPGLSVRGGVSDGAGGLTRASMRRFRASALGVDTELTPVVDTRGVAAAAAAGPAGPSSAMVVRLGTALEGVPAGTSTNLAAAAAAGAAAAVSGSARIRLLRLRAERPELFRHGGQGPIPLADADINRSPKWRDVLGSVIVPATGAAAGAPSGSGAPRTALAAAATGVRSTIDATMWALTSLVSTTLGTDGLRMVGAWDARSAVPAAAAGASGGGAAGGDLDGSGAPLADGDLDVSLLGVNVPTASEVLGANSAATAARARLHNRIREYMARTRGGPGLRMRGGGSGPPPAVASVLREVSIPSLFTLDLRRLMVLLAPRRALRPIGIDIGVPSLGVGFTAPPPAALMQAAAGAMAVARPIPGTAALSSPYRVAIQVVRARNIPVRLQGRGAAPEAEAEGGVVLCLAEVRFQGRIVRSAAVPGPNPQWNEVLHLPFLPPGGDATPARLVRITDEVTISLFDEVAWEQRVDGRDRYTTVLKRHRRYLGTIRIPFFTLYAQAGVHGDIRLEAPAVLLGYRPPAVVRLGPSSSKGLPGGMVRLGAAGVVDAVAAGAGAGGAGAQPVAPGAAPGGGAALPGSAAAGTLSSVSSSSSSLDASAASLMALAAVNPRAPHLLVHVTMDPPLSGPGSAAGNSGGGGASGAPAAAPVDKWNLGGVSTSSALAQAALRNAIRSAGVTASSVAASGPSGAAGPDPRTMRHILEHAFAWAHRYSKLKDDDGHPRLLKPFVSMMDGSLVLINRFLTPQAPPPEAVAAVQAAMAAASASASNSVMEGLEGGGDATLDMSALSGMVGLASTGGGPRFNRAAARNQALARTRGGAGPAAVTPGAPGGGSGAMLAEPVPSSVPRLTAVDALVRFVSLIPSIPDAQAFDSNDAAADVWSTSQQLLDMGAGDMEEHAVLLHNYLAWLEAGGEAAGALQGVTVLGGTAAQAVGAAGWRSYLLLCQAVPDGPSVYVMRQTLNTAAGGGAPLTVIINPTTGRAYLSSDDTCPVKAVGMVVSSTNCWANIQPASAPWRLSWDLHDDRLWAPLFTARHPYPGPDYLPTVQAPIVYRTPDLRTASALETEIYASITALMRRWRPRFVTRIRVDLSSRLRHMCLQLEARALGTTMGAAPLLTSEGPAQVWGALGVDTRFPGDTGRGGGGGGLGATLRGSGIGAFPLGSSALGSSGVGASGGAGPSPVDVGSFGADIAAEHQAALERAAPRYRVQGFPLHASFVDIDSIADMVKATGAHRIEDEGVQYALGVAVVPYPNFVFSVWTYVVVLTPLDGAGGQPVVGFSGAASSLSATGSATGLAGLRGSYASLEALG